MRVIFLAEIPCAFTVNGMYLGVVDGFERTCELDPNERVFCELKPSGRQAVSFFFDEKFLFEPPQHIRLYFMEGKVAVYAEHFLRDDPSLNVVWQNRFGGSLLTLCVQGKLQLNLENETGFHIIPLPDSLETCKPSALDNGFLLESDSGFALISRDGKLLVLSDGRVLEKEPALKAEVPFHDSLAHTALCSWENGRLSDCKIRTTQEPTEATFALAFFESVLIGADFMPYLHESLAEKAGSLREYLGNFESVVLTEERDKIGLVYRRKDRVYDVRCFRVEIADGKVANIKPI